MKKSLKNNVIFRPFVILLGSIAVLLLTFYLIMRKCYWSGCGDYGFIYQCIVLCEVFFVAAAFVWFLYRCIVPANVSRQKNQKVLLSFGKKPKKRSGRNISKQIGGKPYI
jgi:hypothetical protein